jgi:hypothetical protein
MFPAYNPSKEEKKPSVSISSSLFPISTPTTSVATKEAATTAQEAWLKNESFRLKLKQPAATPAVETILINSGSSDESSSDSSTQPITCIGGSSDEESNEQECTKAKRKKKSKKKKKKKKKEAKKRHKKKKQRTKLNSSSEEDESTNQRFRSSSEVNKKLLTTLFDSQYKLYFERFTRDQLKTFIFYDDLPGLIPRNALKLNTLGDKNNLCFDTAHYKIVPKYYINDPIAFRTKARASLANKKKLTRKQLRRQILAQSREKRYFTQAQRDTTKTNEQTQTTKPNVDLAQSTISNRMWLYLEMKNELDSINNATAEGGGADLTADFMKYLDVNKSDVSKWLEFIAYQSLLQTRQSTGGSLYVYEKKQSIFERALKENPDSFRLRIAHVRLKAQSLELLNVNFYNAIELVEAEFFNVIVAESLRLAYMKLSQTSVFNEILVNLFETWCALLDFLAANNSANVFVDKIRRAYIKCFGFFLSNASRTVHATLMHFLATSELFSRFITFL